MFEKKVSKILKLPSVRNCFTLAMTTKLVVIINSFKVPKIKKLLLYEMKFLVPNYSCLQKLWLEGRRLPPPDPRSLSSVLNWICWNPPNKISGYTTGTLKGILRLKRVGFRIGFNGGHIVNFEIPRTGICWQPELLTASQVLHSWSLLVSRLLYMISQQECKI